MQINCSQIKKIFKLIEAETGTHSSTYEINIKTKIHTNVTTIFSQIDEMFTHELLIAFVTDAETGSYIDIGNLKQSKPGNIMETRQIPLTWVKKQIVGSYIATGASGIAVVASAFLYIRYKPTVQPRKELEKTITPYKELIVKTTQKPPKTAKMINMKTFEDLAKTAEILAKPILHVIKGDEHILYILDTTIKYQYKIKDISAT